MIQVRLIDEQGPKVISVAEIEASFSRPGTFVWVDISECDDEATRVLRDVFGFHPWAIMECQQRQRMPKLHAYADHVFVILHSPERGVLGHVHYVELDQFISDRFLVTVHGPTNVAVPPNVPLRDTHHVWERMKGDRFHPRTPMEISHAIISSMSTGMEAILEAVTEEVWALEQRVIMGRMGDPEAFLDEMFRTRHALLAVANITATGAEVYGRVSSVSRTMTDDERDLIADNMDQLLRVQHLADGQRDYLQGVIEFYRTRTDTQMTIAAERLAVIAVVTLPITALASVLGMNLIANDNTTLAGLVIALTIMSAMSAVLLVWAHRRGWW